VKKSLVVFAVICLLAVTTGSLVYAAFLAKVEFNSTSIKTGSASLKLMDNLGISKYESNNLVDSKPSPLFQDISPLTVHDYLVKVVNAGSTVLKVKSTASYSTPEDPSELRRYIMVELIEWMDTNENGYVEEGELGVSYGKKNIIAWKTEGFDLGQLTQMEVRSLVIRFTAPDLPNDKQSTEMNFSFGFSGESIS
jgi:hypothetical protein